MAAAHIIVALMTSFTVAGLVWMEIQSRRRRKQAQQQEGDGNNS